MEIELPLNPTNARNSPRTSSTKFSIILVACVVLAATTYNERLLAGLSRFSSVYSSAFLVLLFVAVLPGRLFILSLPLAIGAVKILSAVNEAKISVLSLPITSYDARVAVTAPSILVNAIGVRGSLYRVGMIVVACALVAGGLTAVRLRLKRRRMRESSAISLRIRRSRRHTTLGMNALCVVVVLAAGWVSLANYGKFKYADVSRTKLWQDLWLPSSQVDLSRRLGVPEYLAFSAFAGNEPIPSFSLTGRGLSIGDTTRVARKFVNVPADAPGKPLPNIVFFHAESSFDPNVVFNLTGSVSLLLWSAQSETRALAPLRVNVIGGGSWVTEFEVLTGVDSRIFGYQGYYTHYYIAPMVKNSFVSYLARKGYRTRAFYPVASNFYKVDEAFKSYGFGDFVDAPALGLPEKWEDVVDRELIAAAIRYGAFHETGPFFYFLSTEENHGPHPCQHFTDARQFLTTFREAASFEQNCQLNEYLRRATSTSSAAERVLAELKRLELETGRPFVLLIYGDHQPWSFTSGVYSIAGGTATEVGFMDFSKLRTDAGPSQTFFHVLASDKSILSSVFTRPPEALFLPTLLSAYVATSYEDLYLPANFVAFESCGWDIRAATCGQYPQIVKAWQETLLTSPISKSVRD